VDLLIKVSVICCCWCRLIIQ